MTFKTFLVGGAVRDEVMGRKSKDLDYVMLAPSFEAMREAILAQGCKIFTETPRCVTIRANHPTLGAVDFACGRMESSYTDGRHPDEVFITTDLKKDLARRDFTMNAIAQEVGTTELIDPFNGLQAIHDREIIAVGNAMHRFQEDRLRIFRAIRFACQLNFNLCAEVINGIRSFGASDFGPVTKERIQVELFKAFSANSWCAAEYLCQFPQLWRVLQDKGIWLKPTLEGR